MALAEPTQPNVTNSERRPGFVLAVRPSHRLMTNSHGERCTVMDAENSSGNRPWDCRVLSMAMIAPAVPARNGGVRIPSSIAPVASAVVVNDPRNPPGGSRIWKVSSTGPAGVNPVPVTCCPIPGV